MFKITEYLSVRPPTGYNFNMSIIIFNSRSLWLCIPHIFHIFLYKCWYQISLCFSNSSHISAKNERAGAWLCEDVVQQQPPCLLLSRLWLYLLLNHCHCPDKLLSCLSLNNWITEVSFSCIVFEINCKHLPAGEDSNSCSWSAEFLKGHWFIYFVKPCFTISL